MLELEKKIPLKEIPFAAFDLETTGIDPLSDEIIEVGIAVFKQEKLIKKFDQLVNPRVPISKEAFQVHGIHEDLLRNHPFIEEILPEIFSILRESVPVAHNAPFDFSFLLEAGRKNNLAMPCNIVVDSCLLAKKLFPTLPNHRLGFLIETFGLKSQQAHRALSDAESCWALFCLEVEKLPLKWDTPIGDFLTSVSGVLSFDGTPFPFPDKLLPFKQFFVNHEKLSFSYRDGKGEITKREVTPMGFTRDGDKTMLVGYCHLRKGTRTFRLDRILELEPIRTS